MAITNMNSVIAKVERKFPIVCKTTKDGSEFKTQKVVIVFNEEEEYPSKIILEQWGDNKIAVTEKIMEGQTYKFNLQYRVNYWKDSNNMETAFWTISAWSIEMIDEWNSNTEDEDMDLPF